MTSASDSIEDLFADKGKILGAGPMVLQGPRGGSEPEAASDSSALVFHHVDSLTYMDGAGHLHAVLLDTVTTTSSSGTSTTIEILSDVAIT